MVNAILGILGLGVLITLSDWRRGLIFCIAVGFLQDPLRKMLPGFPVYTIALVLLFAGLTFASLWLRRGHVTLSPLYGRDQFLKGAWVAFVLVVVVQSLHTLFRYGSLVLPVMGLVSYLSPLLAILLGAYFARNERAIQRFLLVYLAFAIPSVLTVYLSYWFPGRWSILKEIGELAGGSRLVIYDLGTVLYSYSGLFRVGENAAWHAAMACIFLLVFATVKKSFWVRVLVGVLLVLMVGAIMLTGRRKMLMALSLFLGTYWFFISYYWRGGRRNAQALLIVGLAASGLLFWLGGENLQNEHFLRGGTVFSESSDRAGTSYSLLLSAFNRVGFFGAGAGVAAQGSQYFGGGAGVGGATEAGTGKILAELGVPGFAVTLVLLVALMRHFASLARSMPARFTSLTVLMAAFAAAVAANGATFLVATQLYGDLFVLLMLGLMVGFLFGVARIGRQYKAYGVGGRYRQPVTRSRGVTAAA